MDRMRRRTLESAGWRVGTPEEFLNLTEAETAFIEMKLALANGLRGLRLERSRLRRKSLRPLAPASPAWRRWRLPTLR